MAHPTPDALALVALGEGVEGESLRHVGECRACFAEVEALQQVVSVGRTLGPDDRLSTPHPSVWTRVTEDLHHERTNLAPSPVGLLDAPRAARRSRTPRRWTGMALAAAAALVVGLTGGYLLQDLTAPVSSVGARTQLNALPSWHGAGGTASVEDGGDGRRTLLVAMATPPTVSVDGTFEVWMSDSAAQDMVLMGPMTDGTARFPIPASFDLAAHPIVDVSLEPRGDGNPAHSAISVVRGRLPL